MAPELLSTHPYFESLEPDVDDPACILLLPCVGGGGGGNCTPTIGMGGSTLTTHVLFELGTHVNSPSWSQNVDVVLSGS